MYTLVPRDFIALIEAHFSPAGADAVSALCVRAGGKIKHSTYTRGCAYIREYGAMLHRILPQLSPHQERELLKEIIWLSAPRRLRDKYHTLPVSAAPDARKLRAL